MAGDEQHEAVDAGLPPQTEVHDRQHYEQVMAAKELLEVMIAPSHFVKLTRALHDKRCLDEVTTERIISMITDNSNGQTSAWKLFLDHLPVSNENWYWTLMKFLSDAPEDIDIRNLINPCFEEELKSYEGTLQPDIPINFGAGTASGSSSSALPNIEMEDADELIVLDVNDSFQEWLESGRIVPLFLSRDYDSDSDDGDDIAPPETLQLRSYQLELASPANAGKNSIIVAPTGSGKTLVAADIIRHHLESAPSNGTRKKVAFLVPTVHLIEQQSTVLKRHLRQSFKVKGIRGGPVGLRQLPKPLVVRSNDVIVMTPQILLNMMIDPSPGVDPLELDIFTLLIFDECHHAAKSHPYNEIMVKYLDAKLGPTTSDSMVTLPQVVGLTASLGIGHSDTNVEARSNVLKVCANLNTDVLSTVTENKEDLEQYVNVPQDVLVRVRSPHATHPLSIHVTNLMNKIEREFVMPMFEKLKGEEGNRDPRFENVESPIRKYSSDYHSWICRWKHDLPVSCNVEAKQTIITALEHLEVYHNALFLNGHVPASQALVYVNSKLSEMIRRQVSDIDMRLVKLYKDELLPHFNIVSFQNDKNEMTEKLKRILLDEFESRPDGRALIFVVTRALTIALVEYMNEDPALATLGPGRLTGVQASKEQGGQSANEQLAVLEKFRSGQHRVLVVTSVAEEGLDVEKCNLIVKYNNVSGEVAMLQRRGRGRATDSRSILLAQDGCEERELVNLIREKMMLDAVEYIRRMGSDWFRDEVRRMQQDSYNDRQMKAALINQKKTSFEGKSYDLLCVKCDQLMIKSQHVRRVVQSHYVGADPSMWDRVHVDADDLPKIYENMVQAGRIYCLRCRTEFGNVIKYAGVYLPALKAHSIIQDSQDGMKQRHHKRKWKKMTDELFTVDQLTRQDLRLMFNALKSVTVLNKLEERIQFVERQEEEKWRQEQEEKRRQEEEKRRQEQEKRRQEQEKRRQEQEKRRQEEKRVQEQQRRVEQGQEQ